MIPADLPPLRDDVAYDAETAGRYVGRTRIWMIRQARADEIPGHKNGRYWQWSAAEIRSIVAGEPHTPKRRRRRAS